MPSVCVVVFFFSSGRPPNAVSWNSLARVLELSCVREGLFRKGFLACSRKPFGFALGKEGESGQSYQVVLEIME